MEWVTFITLSAAIVSLIIISITLMQKMKTDKRAEWWKRTVWCLDNIDERVKFDIANTMLNYQLSSRTRLTTNEEKDGLAEEIFQNILPLVVAEKEENHGIRE